MGDEQELFRRSLVKKHQHILENMRTINCTPIGNYYEFYGN